MKTLYALTTIGVVTRSTNRNFEYVVVYRETEHLCSVSWVGSYPLMIKATKTKKLCLGAFPVTEEKPTDEKPALKRNNYRGDTLFCFQ